MRRLVSLPAGAAGTSSGPGPMSAVPVNGANFLAMSANRSGLAVTR